MVLQEIFTFSVKGREHESLIVLVTCGFMLLLSRVLHIQQFIVENYAQLRKRPAKPPMLPYRIPIIGHTIAFAKSSEQLIRYGREFFGNTRKVFSITLVGKAIHVLSDARHIATVHSDSATFDFTYFVKMNLLGFGMSKKGADRLYEEKFEPGHSSGRKKHAMHYVHDLVVKQVTGSSLPILVRHASTFFSETISEREIVSATTEINGVNCISFRNWSRGMVVRTLQDTFFGPKLHEIDPSLPQTLMEFSELMWQAWYQLPWFMRRKQISLGKKLKDALQHYMEVPLDERTAPAWFMPAFERELDGACLSPADKASVVQLFYWGSGNNAADITGWIFAHLVFDTQLMDTIRSETSNSFGEDGSLDTYHLTSSSPVLDSLWLEVLRFYASMTSMRNITRDTTIDGNEFKKGSILMFSARQLASDEQVFGADITKFDPMRFYRNPKLQYSQSFRPFGGGKMGCPGRHLTKHVVFSFVAILLRRYNPSLAFPQPFPRTYESEPSIGVIRCRDEFHVKLERRQPEDVSATSP